MTQLFRAGYATTLLRQRDHVLVQLMLIALWLCSLCLLHLDTEALKFLIILLATEALTRVIAFSRCRIVVVGKNQFSLVQSVNISAHLFTMPQLCTHKLYLLNSYFGIFLSQYFL